MSHFRLHGAVRAPKMGKDRQSDPRWIFAGPGGATALAALKKEKDAADDADMYYEIHQTFVAKGAYSPAYRTLCHALADHLDCALSGDSNVVGPWRWMEAEPPPPPLPRRRVSATQIRSSDSRRSRESATSKTACGLAASSASHVQP
eukprot:7267748-Prymnesium_polylepis.1